ncbi:MAG: dihydroorotate dehydrogenase-like protein [Pirellulales bacterium]|nr:dihydroorotate dehydrogenase-like protein [Pirellulales bacterium]
MDLSTKYLGLKLKNPVVVSACPLTGDLDNLKRFEESGAAAAVLPSLFEEQIEFEEVESYKNFAQGSLSFPESLTFYPDLDDYRVGPDTYLEQIEKAKKAVSIPIIASLNGTSEGGWIRYAKLAQDAGADALELNIYFIAASVDQAGDEVERQYLDLVSAVKKSISIPLAVKIGPYFSSPGNMAIRVAEAGADGLVIFNRFLQPDFDLEELAVAPRLVLSSKFEQLLPMRWIAILYNRVQASLALTSGIHDAQGMLKALLAGADVGMIASVLYTKGFGQISAILEGMKFWMEEKEYASVQQLKGALSQQNCPNPSAFERGNYMKVLTSFSGDLI